MIQYCHMFPDLFIPIVHSASKVSYEIEILQTDIDRFLAACGWVDSPQTDRSLERSISIEGRLSGPFQMCRYFPRTTTCPEIIAFLIIIIMYDTNREKKGNEYEEVLLARWWQKVWISILALFTLLKRACLPRALASNAYIHYQFPNRFLAPVSCVTWLVSISPGSTFVMRYRTVK